MRSIAALLISASWVNAAPALISASAINIANPVSTTAAINTTGATLLVAAVETYTPSWNACSLADNKGNTWIRGTLSLGDESASTFYYAWQSVASGTGHTVTLTCNTWASVALLSYSGTQTSSNPLDGQSAYTGGINLANSIQPGPITPTGPGALVVSLYFGMLNVGTYPVSVDSGLTIRATTPFVAGNGVFAVADLVQVSASTVNLTWSENAGSHLNSNVIAFKSGVGALVKHRVSEGQ